MAMRNPSDIAYGVPVMPLRYARHFVDFMHAEGIGRGALLEGTRVRKEQICDPDGFLSTREICSVLARASELVDDETLPFRFGQTLDLARHGLLGYSLLKQDDFKELMLTNISYLRVCLPLLDIDARHQNGTFVLRLRDVWELGKVRQFLVLMYMGSIHTLASLICKRFRFEFDFTSALPASRWSKQVRGETVAFGCNCNQVTMSLSGRPARDDENDIADILARTATRRQEEKRQIEDAFDVVVRVRQRIINEPGRDSTLERVADQLGLCPRSVRRHLNMAGFSFQAIRNEIRERYATRYLTDTRIPLERIAAKLGYSDQASFTKAYRSWTGRTPGHVRRNGSTGKAVAVQSE